MATPSTGTIELRLRRIDEIARSAGLDVHRTRQAVEQIAAQNAGTAGQLESLQRSAAASVALQDQYLPRLVMELQFLGGAMQAQLAALERIEDLIANPAGTASQEHRRRGESLLKRELLPEAKAEFVAALETSPYDPIAHYRLGQALALEDKYASVGDSFAAAVRYSSHPPFTAAACLMASAAFRRTGDKRKEGDILAKGCKAVPSCAELWLAASRIWGVKQLNQALSLAPELVLDASAAKLPNLDQASQVVLDAGYLNAANQYVKAVNDLTSIARKAGETIDYTPPTKPASARAVSLLAWCVLVHSEVPARFSEIASRASSVSLPPVSSPKVKTRGSLGDAFASMFALFIGMCLLMPVGIIGLPHLGISQAGAAIGSFVVLAGLVVGIPTFSYLRTQSRAAGERVAIRKQQNLRATAEGRGRDLKIQVAALAAKLPRDHRPERVIPHFI